MEITTETKQKINWEIEGCIAEADIHNHKLAGITIKYGDTGNIFQSTDEEFTRQVFKALEGLILHLDKERGFDRDVKGPLYPREDGELCDANGTPSGKSVYERLSPDPLGNH